jgi:hypothetical protein
MYQRAELEPGRIARKLGENPSRSGLLPVILATCGGGDGRNLGSRPAQAKKLVRYHLNKQAGWDGIYVYNPCFMGSMGRRITVPSQPWAKI